MAVPKKRHSRARRNRRRAHWKAKAKRGLNLAECPRCHEAKRPHHICPNCGHYRGRQVTGD